MALSAAVVALRALALANSISSVQGGCQLRENETILQRRPFPCVSEHESALAKAGHRAHRAQGRASYPGTRPSLLTTFSHPIFKLSRSTCKYTNPSLSLNGKDQLLYFLPRHTVMSK